MKRILMSLSALFALQFSPINYAHTTGLLFHVTTSGTKLNIKTTIPNHNYAEAGIKITTPGYTLVNAGTDCTPNLNGYCLFATNDITPSTISISGPTGNLDIILCLNGSGPLSCQHYNNIPIQAAPIAKFLYVANSQGAIPVTVCSLDGAGAIVSCNDAGQDVVLAGIQPQGIAINSTNTMAYITVGTTSPVVYQCVINPFDGTFSSCVDTTITSPSGYFPLLGMLAVNNDNSFAYLLDGVYYFGASPRILACPISSNSISGSCTSSFTLDSAYANTNLSGIAINQDGTALYIGGHLGAVPVCDVNGSSIPTCTYKTGGSSITFMAPGGTALNASETLVYITDLSAGELYACDTTPNVSTTFDNCFVATTSVSFAWGIVLNKANTKAYITNGASTDTYICSILPDGTFSSCNANSSFDNPRGIALAY